MFPRMVDDKAGRMKEAVRGKSGSASSPLVSGLAVYLFIYFNLMLLFIYLFEADGDHNIITSLS